MQIDATDNKTFIINALHKMKISLARLILRHKCTQTDGSVLVFYLRGKFYEVVLSRR